MIYIYIYISCVYIHIYVYIYVYSYLCVYIYIYMLCLVCLSIDLRIYSGACMSWVAKNVCRSTLHFFHFLHISLPGTLHQVEFLRLDEHSTLFQSRSVELVNIRHSYDFYKAKLGLAFVVRFPDLLPLVA